MKLSSYESYNFLTRLLERGYPRTRQNILAEVKFYGALLVPYTRAYSSILEMDMVSIPLAIHLWSTGTLYLTTLERL